MYCLKIKSCINSVKFGVRINELEIIHLQKRGQPVLEFNSEKSEIISF